LCTLSILKKRQQEGHSNCLLRSARHAPEGNNLGSHLSSRRHRRSTNVPLASKNTHFRQPRRAAPRPHRERLLNTMQRRSRRSNRSATGDSSCLVIERIALQTLLKSLPRTDYVETSLNACAPSTQDLPQDDTANSHPATTLPPSIASPVVSSAVASSTARLR
jgi:hypothetical protein